ncbi:MAG: hypothetical protein WBE95_19605 [Trebonia sp.]|uniref:hypothetical protein n=1 Tax=Trebonia sp. TaxID=2767075 RepID=UPI003C7745DD
MGEAVTYYAIVNEFSSRERPFGIVRRVKHEGGQRDEVFSRDLKWEHTALLYSAERGDLTNDLVPINEEEAGRIVERIRGLASPDA